MGMATGMRMLYQALASGLAQVMVLYGQVERIKQRLLQRSEVPPMRTGDRKGREGASPTPAFPADLLCEALRHSVSDLLKIRIGEIDAETPLSEYGFDSITFTQFANHLNQIYQLDLTPPLFYEYSTIEQLAQYLHTNYASTLIPYFDTVSPMGTSGDAAGNDDVAAGTSARKGQYRLNNGTKAEEDSPRSDVITQARQARRDRKSVV